jgi:putative flippase GtrA
VLSPEILRFLVAGGVAAVVNWASRFGFSRFLPYEAAVVLAYMCGMVTGFFIMRRWVFDAAAQPLRRQAVTYVVVNLFGLAQTLVISSFLARWFLPAIGITQYVEPLAHAVGIAAPVFTSFIGHKRATFKKPDPGEPAADLEPEAEARVASEVAAAEAKGRAERW